MARALQAEEPACEGIAHIGPCCAVLTPTGGAALSPHFWHSDVGSVREGVGVRECEGGSVRE